AFEFLQTLPALPAGHRRESHCADLHISADGRHLYGSNRGHDSLSVYQIDQATGHLSIVGHEPTLGRTPRNFALDPMGRFVVVANQDSDTLVVLRRDERSGRLSDTGHRAEIGT